MKNRIAYLISNKVFEFVYGEIYFTYKLEGNKATLITVGDH